MSRVVHRDRLSDILSPALLAALAESAERTTASGQPDPDALIALRRSGLLASAVPTEYGGHGGDAVVVNDLVEQLAAVNPSIAIILFQHCAVTARVAEWGDPGQKSRLLPGLADGTYLAASAWSEKGAGAAKLRLSTTATQLPGGQWLLEGEKSFTTGASVADLYLVLAQTDEPAPGTAEVYGSAGQTFFLVRAENTGLVPDLSLDLVGMRGSATGFVSLRDCAVPDTDRLGPRGAAASIIAGVRQTGATLGAVAVGVAQAAVDFAVRHAERRGLLATQSVRHQLVDLMTKVEVARAIVVRSGKRTSADPGVTTLHSKLFASTTAEQVCLDVGRMLGSAGYVTSARLNRMLADVRAVALMGPTNDVCREIVAEASLG